MKNSFHPEPSKLEAPTFWKQGLGFRFWGLEALAQLTNWQAKAINKLLSPSRGSEDKSEELP